MHLNVKINFRIKVMLQVESILKTKSITPSVFKYKQILLSRFIQLLMYMVYNMDHIYH